MHSDLHADYAKAAASRHRAPEERLAPARRAEPPPRSGRAFVAHLLASAARRVDSESARRAVA